MSRFLLAPIMALAVFIGLAPLPASAAEITLAELCTGKTLPLAITYRALTPAWRQFTLNTDARLLTMLAKDRGILPMMEFYSTYYTQWQTVTCGGANFLVAYNSASQLQALLKNGLEGRNDMTAVAVTMDTPLQLCLLNQQTIGNLVDVRPVIPVQEAGTATTLGELLRVKMIAANRKAMDSTLKANLQILRNAIATYEADMGRYPASLTGLYDGANVRQRIHWKGPYLRTDGDVIRGTALPVNPYATSTKIADHWTYSAADGSVVPNPSAPGGNDADGTPYSSY